MSLSRDQDRFYWRLWSGVRKCAPTTDRKAMHGQLGLPDSHTEWNNDHFDEWKRACLAITQPGNVKAQVAQRRMPQTRKLVAIGRLLDALAEGEAYAVSTVRRMNERGRIGQPWAEDRAYVRDAAGEKVVFDYAHTVDGEPARKELTLEQLDVSELAKVVVALKKETKRRWPRKGDLIGELSTALVGLDWLAVDVALCHALHCERVAPLGLTMKQARYEDLLTMLATVRRVRAAQEHDAAEPVEPRFDTTVVAEEDIPF